MKIFIIMMMTVALTAQNYSKLYLLKQKDKERKSNFKNQRTFNKKYKNYIQIIYYDVNNLDTQKLKELYNLRLDLAIADGVLVFIYEGKKSLTEIIQKIKKEQQNIKSVRPYVSKELKPF